ncbi:unnamed protein product [Strongylus vulgaris]|uniref:Peptidase A1 domain-containing protein n=1 Tax=Strongylus vulgaris TaxID=40348 RepID=A0A3P7L885_STRVU|nr:unnamed protein product [Strongylus vulgaris]
MLFFIDCEASDADIGVVIGGKKYTMTAKNLIFPLEEDLCVLAFQSRLFPTMGPQWILGSPFLREYCNIHDFGKNQIGFAKVK